MSTKWIAIVVAAVVVVAAAAGFGGYTAGTSAGRAQALAARTQFLQARGLGGGQGGQGAGGQFNPNNFVNGQVKAINGNAIELSTATAVVTVDLGSNTQILKMGAGSASDIQPGERITVQGTRNSDGSLTAQSVQIGRQQAAVRAASNQASGGN